MVLEKKNERKKNEEEKKNRMKEEYSEANGVLIITSIVTY